MKAKTILGLGAALACTALLNGCVLAFGNRVPPPEQKATLGKQLTDLKQARESGAINEEEYQAAKKRLIEGQ